MPFGCAGGTTESGLKMIQDSELVIKLAVYVCITGKAIKIIKQTFCRRVVFAVPPFNI